MATARRRWEIAARLCATPCARGSAPAYAAGYIQMVKAVRSALGAVAFDQAYEWGEELPLDESMAAALHAVEGSPLRPSAVQLRPPRR